MNWKRGMEGFKDEPLSLEQAEVLNSLFKKYELKEMSIRSHSLWFGGGDGAIYRKVNHLSREQIFALEYDFKNTVYTTSFIIDGGTKVIEFVVRY